MQGTMRLIALDTETWLIAPGRLAPRLVCASFAQLGEEPYVLARKRALSHISELIEDSAVSFVLHNGAFDFAVLIAAGLDQSLVWRAYDEGRVFDTQIHSQMISIAMGTAKFDPQVNRRPKHSLAALSERFLGEVVSGKSGDDIWRLRYRELDGVEDAKEYPTEAYRYAAEDARITLRVWDAQSAYVREHLGLGRLPDLTRQCCYAWALHLMTCWGLRTDPAAVAALETDLQASVVDAIKELQGAGLYRLDGTKDIALIRKLVKEALGSDVPTTRTGQVSTSVETLRLTGVPSLVLLADISNDSKLLSTYVPLLQKGTTRPIQPRYGLAESGRSTSSGPNIQNQPRRGGVRECFVPRAGSLEDPYVYVAADYHVAELAGLAQVLLDRYGQSALADSLKAGRELHLQTAAQILNITYEEASKRHKEKDPAVKEARQLAKALNFGLPAGLGPKAFCSFAGGYGIEVSEREAGILKDKWLAQFPYMARYFAEIGTEIACHGGRITHHRSQRIRGGCTFTAACNTYFQGIVADGAKSSLWLVARECYSKPDSVLFGCRPVAFIHDEILLESPSSRASEVAQRLSEVMEAGMAQFIPDVPVRADAHIMERWYKDAEPAFDEAGNLIPWRPNGL